MALGTTYFAGNDIISFLAVTSDVIVNGNSNEFRPAWVNNSLTIAANNLADPPNARITSPLFPANALMWVRNFYGWPALGGSVTNDATCLQLLDGGTARILVRGGSTNGIKICKRTAAGVITVLATSANNVVPVGGFNVFSITLKVHYAVSGEATLFVNETQVATFSGDVTTDGATTLNQAEWASISGSQASTVSEEIISDKILINAGLFRLPPLATGTTQLWSGVATDIDKIGIDDTSFISDNNATDLSGWTTPVTFPTGAWLVQGIVQEARAAVGIAGPQHFDWYLRTADGSDHLGGASNAPGLLYTNFNNFVWQVNPHTSADWVQGDIVAGFNLGVESLA